MGRTQHLAGDRQTRLSVEPLGQSKISDSRLVRRGVDEHVGWFEIAVKDALSMRVVNRFGNELHVAGGVPRWQRTLSNQLSEVPSLDIVHREKVVAVENAHFVNRHDI